MDAVIKKRWVEALKSGKFKQGKHHLKHGNQNGTRYCCLGVLLEIDPNGKGDNGKVLDYAYRESVGISYSHQNHLAELNDEENKNFCEIANFIEEWL